MFTGVYQLKPLNDSFFPRKASSKGEIEVTKNWTRSFSVDKMCFLRRLLMSTAASLHCQACMLPRDWSFYCNEINWKILRTWMWEARSPGHRSLLLQKSSLKCDAIILQRATQKELFYHDDASWDEFLWRETLSFSADCNTIQYRGENFFRCLLEAKSFARARCENGFRWDEDDVNARLCPRRLEGDFFFLFSLLIWLVSSASSVTANAESTWEIEPLMNGIDKQVFCVTHSNG